MFVCQSFEFIGECFSGRVVSAKEVGYECVTQRIKPSPSLTHDARIFEGVVYVCEGALWRTKGPHSERPIGQIPHAEVLTKKHRQRTMLSRIVKRDRMIEVP